jgi:hypothetical protein
VDVEFLVDAGLHDPAADAELVGDFLLEEPLCQQFEHFILAGGELAHDFRRGGGKRTGGSASIAMEKRKRMPPRGWHPLEPSLDP